MMTERIKVFALSLVAALLMAGDVARIPPEREENSVGPNEAYLAQDSIILCGDLVDADSVQTFFGPAVFPYLGLFSNYEIGSAGCNALDSETEATADNFIISMPAFKVSGFYCIMSTDPNNDVTFTLRSAEANTTPTISCTVTGSVKYCSTTTGSTTDIAAGATIAIQADYSEDLDAEDAWCKLYFAVRRK
jgi:hypothetical protein